MIIDHLDSASEYYGCGVRLDAALRYLRNTDLRSLPSGRHEIDGENLFALVFEYQTKRVEDTFWEAHRRYIDVQYVEAGVERMGYAPLRTMRHGPYDDEKDYVRAEGDGEFFLLRAGFFTVLWPHDAHMPGLVVERPAPVKKVVMKVRIS